jgi:uncharacterized protein YraI
MTLRSTLAAVAFTTALAAPVAANAIYCTTADVYLRSGPGVSYSWYVVIPAYTEVNVYGWPCYGWCQVVYNNYQGYVSARYVADYCTPPPRYQAPPRRYVPRYVPRY